MVRVTSIALWGVWSPGQVLGQQVRVPVVHEGVGVETWQAEFIFVVFKIA